MPATHTQGAAYHITVVSGAVVVLELVVVVWVSEDVLLLSWAKEYIADNNKRVSSDNLTCIVLIMFFIVSFFVLINQFKNSANAPE
jgi:NADH:ubiquinone oxidoreductase subunit 6 (subunit J)